MAEQMYNVNDEVRICVRDKNRPEQRKFKMGRVTEVRSTDISHHGSPCYQYTYRVKCEDGKSAIYSVRDSDSTGGYISPIPTIQQLADYALSETEYCMKEIQKLQERMNRAVAKYEKVTRGEIPIEEVETYEF